MCYTNKPMSFRRVKAEKIRAIRNGRSLQDIADASGGSFSKGLLWQWETRYKNAEPTNDKIPDLVRALGCTYEDISEPVEMAGTV